MDISDYSYVLDGWFPRCGLPVESDWYRGTHLGLQYIYFRNVLGGLTVVCRIDPCSCVEAMAAYAVMVRRDMDHEIDKALTT